MTVFNENKVRSKGKTHVQWLSAISATTTLLTHGMQLGWVAPSLNLLKSEESPSGRPLTDNEISWIAAIIPLAASVGTVLFASIVDKCGRKKAIILIAALQAICWILNIISSTVASLLIGRVFAGLAGGGCYNVIPMYVREISQDDIRGILGSFLTLMHNLGYLFMFAMGYYMDYYVVLWIILWFPVANIVMMLFCPESPPFLVKKQQIDKAASTLVTLRGFDQNDDVIKRELEYMQNQENMYKSIPNITFLNIWQNKSWRYISYLNMSLLMFRNFSGNFAILTFTPTIMASSGVVVQPELQSLTFPAVMIIATIVVMSCVDKFGRKFILIITLVLGALSLAVLATSMLIQNQGYNSPGWVSVASIVVYFIAYAGGISPLPYIILAEMCTFHIRTKVIGALVTILWFCSFLQMLGFISVTKLIGQHNVFYCYAGINLIGAFVSLIYLPETKGKTVEEIENDLKERRK